MVWSMQPSQAWSHSDEHRSKFILEYEVKGPEYSQYIAAWCLSIMNIIMHVVCGLVASRWKHGSAFLHTMCC